jgi:hypothetical protein
MNKQSLNGQFLKGKPQKHSKPQSKTVADSNTMNKLSFKPNGRILPKRGAE